MIWPTKTTEGRLTILGNAEIAAENCEIVVRKEAKDNSIVNSYFENCSFIYESLTSRLKVFKDCYFHNCTHRLKE